MRLRRKQDCEVQKCGRKMKENRVCFLSGSWFMVLALRFKVSRDKLISIVRETELKQGYICFPDS